MGEFRDMYKNVNQLKEQQSLRRQRLLEDRRKQREDQFAFQRDLLEIVSVKNKKSNQNKSIEKSGPINGMFKNNLMLSEWMMSRPDDIEDFILVPCPKGIRCSISTGENKRKTANLYYKNGSKFKEVKTNLPSFTTLDCVLSVETRTIYILDTIMYAGRDFNDCDSSFRFFWLKSKFIEDDLKIIDTETDLKLELLSTYDFSDKLAIKCCFQTFPIISNDTELDGYLFYHKEGSYTAGETPLVLWLFPFMVDELFNDYHVNPCYNSARPENYTTYLDFIEEFNRKFKQRGKKRSKKDEHMEVTESSIDEEFDERQAMIDLEMTGNDVQ